MKRVLSLLVVLALVLALAPAALAAGWGPTPTELTIGENTAEVPAQDYDGRPFTWTAPEAGTLTIKMNSDNWFLNIGVNGNLDVEECVNYADPYQEFEYDMAADDVFEIYVSTYDLSASSIFFSASFKAAGGESGGAEQILVSETAVSSSYNEYYWGIPFDVPTIPADGIMTVNFLEGTGEFGVEKNGGDIEWCTSTDKEFEVSEGESYTVYICPYDDSGYFGAGTVKFEVVFTPTSGSTDEGGDVTVPDSPENAALVDPFDFKYTIPAGAKYYFAYNETEDYISERQLTVSLVDTTLVDTSNIDYTVAHSGGSYPCDEYGTSTSVVSIKGAGYFFWITNNGEEALELRIAVDDKPEQVLDGTEIKGTVTLESETDTHIEYIAVTEPGTISITISGDPAYGFRLWYPDESSTILKTGTTEEFYTFEVTEDGLYQVEMMAYSYVSWSATSGTVTYSITFTSGDVQVQKPATEVSDLVITEPGTYTADMEYADVTIVTVSPAVTGVYQFTVNGQALIGNYGGYRALIPDPNNVEHFTSFQWTCEQAPYEEEIEIMDENDNWITVTQQVNGQSLMLGIKPNSEDVQSVQIVVEKIADYTPAEVIRVEYENKAELTQFELPEGATLGGYVNVYDEQTHTAVLGTDGYYHLDAADGPILLVDMDYQYALTDYLDGGMATGMLVYSTDENGNIVLCDIENACYAYEAVCDENGYYPLTEDLIYFYKDFGESHGISAWVLGTDAEYNADSAWMWACLTMTLPEEPAEEPAAGTEESPILIVDISKPILAPVAAGQTVYYEGNLSGTILTIENAAGVTVTVDDKEYTADSDGVLTIEFPAAQQIGRPSPVVIAITNNSNEAATYSISIAYPVGDHDNPAQLVIGENTATLEAGDEDGYYFTWTAPEDGQLTVNMDPSADWSYSVSVIEGVYGNTHWSDDKEVVASETITVKEGDQVEVRVSTYNPADPWNYPAGEVVFTAFFKADNAAAKEEYVLSDTKLQLGENKLTLDASAETTIYQFNADQDGLYEFRTASGFLVGYWGAGTFYIHDFTGLDKTNVLQYEITDASQSVMLGITGQGFCTVTITRVGDVEKDPIEEIAWTVYENKVEPTKFGDLAEDAEFIKLDVTQNEYTAVLGSDGYYHLNSADGPVLLVNLGLNAPYVSIQDTIATRTDTLRAVVYDENGNVVKKIEFGPAAREYVDNINSNGLYPLTEDLVTIFKTVGADPNNGWYDPNGLFPLFGEGVDAGDDAWMFACGYVKSLTYIETPDAPAGTPDAPAGTPDAPAGTPDAPAGTPDAPAGTPDAPAGTPDAPAGTPDASGEAPEASENPKTGDTFSIALVSALVLVSGMGVAVLTVSKKKFF